MNKRFAAFAAVIIVPTLACVLLGRGCSHEVFFDRPVENDALEWRVDEISWSDPSLAMKGYLLLQGDMQWSGWGNKSVWINDVYNKKWYRFPVTENAYSREIDGAAVSSEYRYCGFSVKIDLSDVLKEDSIMKVYLVYQDHDDLFGVDTGYEIVDGRLCDMREQESGVGGQE